MVPGMSPSQNEALASPKITSAPSAAASTASNNSLAAVQPPAVSASKPFSSKVSISFVTRRRWPPGWSHQSSRASVALQLAPAAGPVVGNDVFEHGGEGGCVDGLALVDGHGTGGLVVMAGGYDP